MDTSDRAQGARPSISICRSGASARTAGASIAFRDRLESMKLIEEFMIQANVAAAETLEKARVPPALCVHEALEGKSQPSDYLRTIGINFAKGQVIKPGVFNRILTR
jgi:ribonuclease R